MSPRQGARLVVRHSSFGHPKCALGAFIEGHPLNHAIEIISPIARQFKGSLTPLNSAETSLEPGQASPICGSGAAEVSPSTSEPVHGTTSHGLLEESLRRVDSREYTLVRCNLACLVEHDFVERQIRAEAASFCAVSVDRRADTGDSAAILPDGKLHLAISKEAYHRLGLQGAHVPHNPGRYHIEVDLFGRSYAPGAPFYTKVMDRLRSHTGPLTFLCVKTIDGATADIGFPAGTELPQDSRMRPASTKTDLRSPAPAALRAAALHGSGQAELQGADLTGASVQDDLAVYEWLGGLSCGISGTEASGESAAEAANPEHVTRLTFKGLLPACSAMDAVQAARQQVNRAGHAWAAVHVWGFQDTPVSWHGACHGHGPLLGGENDYTVLLLPGDQYVLYVAAGEGDHFSSIALSVQAA